MPKTTYQILLKISFLTLTILFISCKILLSLDDKETVTIDKLFVKKVIDGDTVLTTYNNQEVKIRLLGIQAPETNTLPPELFSKEAKDLLTNLIERKTIKITFLKKQPRDKYNRILADVYLSDNNQWINGELVKNGVAYTYILNSNDIPRIKELLSLENIAINNKINYWSLNENLPIKASITPKYIGEYKIVQGKILKINKTKKSTWLQMEESENKGFSIRIDNENISLISKNHNIKELLNKEIRVRGFIEKYSPKFGPYINLYHPFSIEILK